MWRGAGRREEEKERRDGRREGKGKEEEEREEGRMY